MENLSDTTKLNGNQGPQAESQKNLSAKIFTSNHLDEIGFLVILLLTLVFSFLFFYFGLPSILDKLNITSLKLYF